MADEIKQTIVIEASLTKIQASIKELEGNFSSAFSKISSIGQSALGSLGVGLSIGGVIGFGKEILNLASQLEDLSAQTGISSKTLSGLKSVLEENGSSLETFAKGVFKLQTNLGNADEEGSKTALAIKDLGLNLDKLRNASPDEFIKQTTDALGKIENPITRNTLLFNLLGKSAKELGPAFQELAGHFDEFASGGLSENTITQLDALGDAFTRLKNNVLTFGANFLASALAGLGVIQRTSERIRQDIEHTQKFAAGDIGRIMSLQKELAGAESSEAKAAAKKAASQAPFKKVTQPAGAGGKDTGVADFFANLQKQAQGLDVQLVGLRDGEAVAKALALDFQLIDFNKKRAEEGKPLASTEQFAKLKAAVLTADAALVKFKADKDLVEIDQKLFTGTIDTSTAEGKQKKMVADVTFEFISMAKKIEEVGRNAQLTQQEIADRIGLAWQGSVTKINEATAAAKKSLDELRQNMAIESIPTDTLAGVKQKREAGIQADFKKTETNIRDLGVTSGASPEQIAADIAKARQKFDDEINSKDVFENLRRSIATTAAEAQALGGAINVPAKNVGDLTSAIQTLISRGLSPLSPQIQQLKAQLEDAQWMERLESGFDRLSDTLLDFSGDWKKLGMSIKGVIDDIVKDFLKMQLKQAFGGMFGGGGGSLGNDQLGGLISAARFSGFGSLPTGFGSAPAGVEGPSLPNGGFFSNPTGFLSSIGSGITKAFGGIASFFGFHGGGLITPGGEFASFSRVIKMHSGGEVPVLAQTGEFMLNKMAASRIGSPSLNFMNRTGAIPQGALRTGGSNGRQNVVVNINSPNFADRKSQGQVLARLGSSVRNANRNL